MIKPTIGRVVLVRDRNISDQAMPAFICYVHSDTCINVAGFDGNGHVIKLTSLTLRQDYSGDQDVPAEPYAEWMPYQREVAAKSAATVKERY